MHVMHIGWDDPIRSLGDLPWISFEDGIEHIFPQRIRRGDGRR